MSIQPNTHTISSGDIPVDTPDNSIGRSAPFLIKFLEDYVCIPCGVSPKVKRIFYLSSVWIITFICYASFHLSRKPTSVVKGTLRPKCVQPNIPVNTSNGTNDSIICFPGWAPFDGDDGNTLLGSLDYSFLFSYAIAMFFSGHIGDRVPLRYFLTVGMIGSGLMACLFGAGYFFNIHVIEYYLAVQIVGGMFQSTGWPGVVAVMNHWFGRGYRGFLLGIWNVHTSVGNILGSVIPGIWADTDWGWSFISAGLIIIVCGVLVFLTLVSNPDQVDLPPPTHNKPPEDPENDLTPLIKPATSTQAIGFFNAFLIPGVLEYSFSLFFGKLVSYTFLFWLPLYIQNTQIGGKTYNGMVSADLSTVYDVGGIIGGITGGLLSDIFNSRSIVCVTMYYLAIPCLFAYLKLGYISLPFNMGLMCLCGILVNGPYGLITTAVTADLGTHPSLRDNTNAKATVTAIIDGTGSIGAALGPLLAGWVSGYGWNYVFYIQMGSCSLAAILLSRLVIKDIIEFATYLYKKLLIF
ncbi:hypothetical protein LOD99_152 [Oopsacas minuta]|uniref:Sugar phosphate exchanger 3 n=1 Tax=Oopsacas minuta TaxID=111878 RepID=A0AAV7K888_9METZ|nr:hypothetical protein LOD99_152 [Oopsacas minuta]